MSRVWAVLAATVCAMVVLAVGGSAGGGAAMASQRLPEHMYASYFETWTTNHIDAVARRSGARYFTLAFLQAPSRGSCTVAWNGDPTQTMAGHGMRQTSPYFAAMGGDVIPSFGGYSADHGGTEIADSCTASPAGRSLRVGDPHLRRVPTGYGRRGQLTGQRRRHRRAGTRRWHW